MADRDNARDRDRIRMQDVVQVGSRISWGAIFGGSIVALAIFFLMAALGGAIGLSVYGDVDSSDLATGARVWGIISAIVALFFGGFVTSQFTVGEGRVEAGIYGLILWGVVALILLHLTASGLETGSQVMTGISRSGGPSWQDSARQAGVSTEQITIWERSAENGASAGAVSEETQQAAWAAFGGTVLCMLAAVVGAIVGAGPKVRLIRTVRPGDEFGGRPAPTAV